MTIILEGPSHTGKSALLKLFDQRSGYVHTCVERFGFSQLVYAAYYKRTLWENRALRAAHVAMLGKFLAAVHPLYVFTYAAQVTVDARILAALGEPFSFPSIVATHGLYRQMFDLVGLPDKYLLSIDTTAHQPMANASLTACSDMIASKVIALGKTR